MTEDGFYEDDEPIEDVQAAWQRGEAGRTKGPRDLNQRAKSILDRAVARFEDRHAVRVRVVGSDTVATTTTEKGTTDAAGPLLDRVEDSPVTATEYLVV